MAQKLRISKGLWRVNLSNYTDQQAGYKSLNLQ